MKNADSARYIGKKIYSTLCKVYYKTLWTVLCSFVNYKGSLTTNEVGEDIFKTVLDKNAFDSMCRNQIGEAQQEEDLIKKFEVSEEDFGHHAVPWPNGVSHLWTPDKQDSRQNMNGNQVYKLDLD